MNDDAVPAPMVDEIDTAGGIVSSESRRVSESGPGGLFHFDEATDWTAAVANDQPENDSLEAITTE